MLWSDVDSEGKDSNHGEEQNCKRNSDSEMRDGERENPTNCRSQNESF